MLIRPDTTLEFAKISWTVILSAVAISVLFFLFVLGIGLRALRLKPVTGIEGLVGEIGESLEILNPMGSVWVHGERWRAESVAGKINKGEKVRVAEIKDLKLRVEPVKTNL